MRRGKKRKKKQDIEYERHFDCRQYDECLDHAAKKDIRTLSCVQCQSYDKISESYEIFDKTGVKKPAISSYEEMLYSYFKIMGMI